MVQLLVTVALTPRFAVAVAAKAGALKAAAAMATPLTAAANPRNVFARIAVSPRLLCVSIERCLSRRPFMGLVRYPIPLHGRGHVIPEMNHRRYHPFLQSLDEKMTESVTGNRTSGSANI
jgi:hypothetical protein